MSLALVLAGGGVTGIAWELGVLLGLRDGGVDVAESADIVIGTSAGAAAGAQLLSSTDLADLFERQTAAAHQELTPILDVDTLTAIFAELNAGIPDAAVLAKVGSMALATPTVPEERRRRVIEWRLPSHDWPDRPFRVTAVDAETGEFVVFDADGGVPLVDAVAASCAVPGVWPPVSIDGRRYMDGGCRSTANADLAAGCDTVLVVAPLTGPMSASLAPQLEALERDGADVVLLMPDDEAAEAMGLNPLDPEFRPPAAEHGRRQGRATAASLLERGVAAR